MNIVRNRSDLHGIGQIYDEPIVADLTTPMQPESAVISPYQSYGSAYPDMPIDSGSPAPAPATSVPKPPSSPIYATFGPYGTLDPTAYAAPSQTSPAPRVNIPTNTVPGMMAASLGGVPMIAWLGLGIVGVLALTSGGGRRRR